MSADIKKEEFISKSKIKTRGWTEKLIDEFLSEPDKLSQNPFYRNAPDIKLYKIDRVEKIEDTVEFKELYEKTKKRKESSKKAILTKTKNIIEYVDGLIINIKKIDEKELKGKAIDSFNEWKSYKSEDGYCGNGDKLFFNRIIVNFLRHECSNYEKKLDEIYGKVGIDDAYMRLKNKVLDAIKNTYPFLSEECERQKIKI